MRRWELQPRCKCAVDGGLEAVVIVIVFGGIALVGVNFSFIPAVRQYLLIQSSFDFSDLQSGYRCPFPSPVAVCQSLTLGGPLLSRARISILCEQVPLLSWNAVCSILFSLQCCQALVVPLKQAGRRRSSASHQSGWSSTLPSLLT